MTEVFPLMTPVQRLVRMAAVVCATATALLGAVAPASAQEPEGPTALADTGTAPPGTSAEAAQVGAAAAPAQISVVGKGNGHGRGMGQFGAMGYAVDHGWNHAQILNHFYGGTRMATVLNEQMLVHLTAYDGHHLIVTSDRPFVIDETWTVPAGQAALIAVVGDNIFDIYLGPSCGGPWTRVALHRLGDSGRKVGGGDPYIPVVPAAANYGNDRTGVLVNCIGARGYRGALRLYEQGRAGVTVNALPLEQYLRGVVPREFPASWGTLPSGTRIDRGIQAAMAQAVAARSYALALAHIRRARGTFEADTCDTQACQVYQGALVGTTPLDYGPTYVTTNTAVGQTAGQVRVTASGAVALTEFASSTGGYTSRPSEGNGFAAVPDVGDATVTMCRIAPSNFSCNPYREWVVNIPRSQIEATYPEIGTLQSINVTRRNGLGLWGGRVQQVVIRGTAGTRVLDIPNWAGDTFRRSFGLRSDWYRFPQFEVTTRPGDGTDGFWVVKANGAVSGFGKARHFGDASNLPLRKPIVAAAGTATSRGYWLTASDGGVFSYGDARFHGSAGNIALWQPVVGMAPTPTGGGYWLVASDGGIFSYGDAQFRGSMGGRPLWQPVVAMAPTASGRGYWLVASDGGIFTFGDARFLGSAGGRPIPAPVVGMAALPDGRGYWMLGRDGSVYSFGAAVHYGDRSGLTNRGSFVGIAGDPGGRGYWLITDQGTSYPFGDVGDYQSSSAGAGVVTVAAAR
jgi:SpoIID/LytB domain protein